MFPYNTLQGNTTNLQGSGSTLQGTSSTRVRNPIPVQNTQPSGIQMINQTPQQPTTNVLGASQNDASYWATGAAPAAPAYDQGVVDQFDSGISALNTALGQIPRQLEIAKANVGDQYSTALNRLQSAYNAANNQYGQQSTGNMQSLRTNKNNILDQQSQGLRGLLRTLGMYGAVGSDADLASGVVTDQATRERSGAGSVFAQNQRGLDTNWGNFQNEDKNKRKEALDWKRQQERQVSEQTLTTKQDLLSRLAELKGQRAATIGGSFKGGAQPYLDQANALSSRITELRRFKPSFNGTTPVYNAPSLDSYQMGQGPQIQAGGQPQTQTPALQALLGLGQREDEDKIFY